MSYFPLAYPVEAPAHLDFEELDLRMAPGGVIAVTLQTVSSTATTSVSLNYQEVG